MLPITSVTIVFDPTCGLCTRTVEWIREQTALIGLDLVAGDSPEARERFPQLPSGELAVVGNTGEVWLGNQAWIICLWALRDFRELAFRLTSPLVLPFAREAFSLVSKHRAALSDLLRVRNAWEMKRELKRVAVPRCQP